ncbi:hypothetical protein EVAR_18813_1 [Eumeta japonica]|uniref:Uncharacterized protein n=1 Tax=Eumeta variegata TaxID=151549 RepID=A0A4C1UMD0_EUMVA|nr:hypothetical protein EVAR_18813_1 [Eumeta japonica]
MSSRRISISVDQRRSELSRAAPALDHGRRRSDSPVTRRSSTDSELSARAVRARRAPLPVFSDPSGPLQVRIDTEIQRSPAAFATARPRGGVTYTTYRTTKHKIDLKEKLKTSSLEIQKMGIPQRHTKRKLNAEHIENMSVYGGARTGIGGGAMGAGPETSAHSTDSERTLGAER